MSNIPVRATPPNKRLKLTGHRALQVSVLPSGHEIKRFQLPGHRGRQLSRDPLGGATNREPRMFFARVRWVGRVLDGAGIDTNSKMGRELSTTLIKFSKYCQEKNRRGEGARGVRLNLGPAEWAVLGSIFAPEEPRVADHVAEALGLSHSDAVSLVNRTRESALELAEREMPDLLPSVASE